MPGAALERAPHAALEQRADVATPHAEFIGEPKIVRFE
jgi:hypothetical protein